MGPDHQALSYALGIRGDTVDDSQSEIRKRYMGIGIALGVAIGAGLGVAFGSLAMGMGPGIAIGVAIGYALGNKHAKAAEQSPRGDDGGDG